MINYEEKYKRLFSLVHRMRDAQIEMQLSPNQQARQYRARIELAVDKHLRDELIEQKKTNLFSQNLKRNGKPSARSGTVDAKG